MTGSAFYADRLPPGEREYRGPPAEPDVPGHARRGAQEVDVEGVHRIFCECGRVSAALSDAEAREKRRRHLAAAAT